jgi:hypothetical protein
MTPPERVDGVPRNPHERLDVESWHLGIAHQP